ncbi:uncharacterized protein BDW47DRAFT_129903 [Aspergillus candidus]|uniref:Uncharacterized protein n=1 Tax=Aspergillus candidus TaxID=41067 RepID=A0A2I2EYM3_ASPCN|nr:hypothetical protein BDW47DRAFT_129903 [Aspergillus candidus]PLB33481.1 hypothetical protein BDW47DRAFT_129903 [Aspergillus candidus]
MQVKSAFSALVFCAILTPTWAGWSIDRSCGPVTGNIEKAIKNIMKWPAEVTKSLGKDKDVNEFAARLFNTADFEYVKDIISKIGAQSAMGNSQVDDPIIYCTQDRLEERIRASNQEKYYYDTLGKFTVDKDTYEGCEDKDTFGYTTAFWEKTKSGKGQTTMQLCPKYLKDIGQTPILDGKGKPQNKKLHDSYEKLKMMHGTDIHINDFAGLELTLFHEFVHTPKVRPKPQIMDHGYFWNDATGLSKDKALDNAESYALLALGTWLINQRAAHIQSDGTIEWLEDELAMKKRTAQPWTA